MLASIERYLSPSLLRAVQEKIEYEASSLRSLLASEEKRAEAFAKRNKVLNSHYFVQKRLDTSIY